MGMTAENLAIKYKITRQECDEYALKSQERWREGKYHKNLYVKSKEYIPMRVLSTV